MRTLKDYQNQAKKTAWLLKQAELAANDRTSPYPPEYFANMIKTKYDEWVHPSTDPDKEEAK